MPSIRRLVTQGGVDTFAAVAINTSLTVDGKAGWQINSMRATWNNASAVAAADWSIFAICSSIATLPAPADDEYILGIGWGLQNTAGVAVVSQYEPIKKDSLVEPRITVQPYVYLQVSSNLTGATNNMTIEIFYEIVKLSDLEVLRLLAGGA